MSRARDSARSRWIEEAGSAFLNLCYPDSCPACEGPLNGAKAQGLCDRCHEKLWPCRPPCCRVCGEIFGPEGSRPFTCQTCRGRRFAFRFAVAAYQSRDLLRDLIHRFKYQRQMALARPLGRLSLRALEDPRLGSVTAWVAVPVPLHPRRYREREFNQAEELCRVLRKATGIETIPALRRTRYTCSQTQYRRDQRMENLRDAFQIRPGAESALGGRQVLLVDDVFTTGSTANECAKVLRRDARAEKVVVVTLARG